MTSKTLILLLALVLVAVNAALFVLGAREIAAIKRTLAANQQEISRQSTRSTVATTRASRAANSMMTPHAEAPQLAALVADVRNLEAQLQELAHNQRDIIARLDSHSSTTSALVTRDSSEYDGDRASVSGAAAYETNAEAALQRFRSNFETQVVNEAWSRDVETELLQSHARLYPNQPLQTESVDCRERGCQIEIRLAANSDEDDVQNQIVDAIPSGFSGFSFFPVATTSGERRIVVYLQKR